jgi:hypothetical protein
MPILASVAKGGPSRQHRPRLPTALVDARDPATKRCDGPAAEALFKFVLRLDRGAETLRHPKANSRFLLCASRIVGMTKAV